MATQSNDHKYKMTISLSVLDHLGRGLYSNVPAVLSEVVANAWDADAENVDISINSDDKTIVITDDGFGMTLDDINRRFLNIGYQKRADVDYAVATPRGRKPMGRKGIGKLSAFAIANTVEVFTIRGDDRNAFRMDYNDIQTQIETAPNSPYHPTGLPPEQISIEKGTRIALSNLRNLRMPSVSVLRRRLARKFTILGSDNFYVSINGDRISAKDREYQRQIEYVWYFGGDANVVSARFPNAKHMTSEDCAFGDQNQYAISGWIGTIKSTKEIPQDTIGIAIFARGKVVHDNLLENLQKGGMWTKYVVGEIDAEFMDDDSTKEDIITSDRQSLKEDDPRFELLKAFLLNGVIARITTNWQRLRIDSGSDWALGNLPSIKRWYDRLKGDEKKSAKTMIGVIGSNDELDHSARLELYKAFIFAFRRFSITKQLSIFEDIETTEELELLSRIFGNVTELARVQYYDIANVRVDAIRVLKDLVSSNEYEKFIQEHIFDNLWLLDPAWVRTPGFSSMEETVNLRFSKLSGRASKREKTGRIDIRYQTVSGINVIVELKRPDAPKVNVYRLCEQLSKYREGLETELENGPDKLKNAPIVTIALTGRRKLTTAARRVLDVEGVRWLTYREVIDRALSSHEDYLKAEEATSEEREVIDGIAVDLERVRALESGAVGER